MSSYIIEGGKALEGTVNISGSKNASLPIIAASILNGGVSKLYNVPNIHDTQITLKILKILGCKIDKKNGKIIIDSSKMNSHEIPDDLMRQMRSSVVLAGAILARFKNAKFSYPGGCDIGARPIDLHLKALKKLGIDIEEESGYVKCRCDQIIGNEIHLDFPSVGATENIILASVLAKRRNGSYKCCNGTRNTRFTKLFKQNGSKSRRCRNKCYKNSRCKKIKRYKLQYNAR